jgi:hypothetical protein
MATIVADTTRKVGRVAGHHDRDDDDGLGGTRAQAETLSRFA